MVEVKHTEETQVSIWEQEYSALPVNKKVLLQLMAKRFGVPLIAVFHRAKDLGVFTEVDPLYPPTREEGGRDDA